MERFLNTPNYSHDCDLYPILHIKKLEGATKVLLFLSPVARALYFSHPPHVPGTRFVRVPSRGVQR
jgi:hypothetical protein